MYTKVFGLWLRAKAAYSGDQQYALARELAQQQYLPSDALHQLQITRFKLMVLHAIDRSDYYRSRLGHLRSFAESMNTLDQLGELPLLRREDIQANGSQIKCPGDKSIYADSSGGSTGIPVNFFHDGRYRIFGNALHQLFLSWIGVAPGDKVAFFWGADRDFKDLGWRERISQRFSRSVNLNSFNVQVAALDSFLDKLTRFRPTYVVGYASSLFLAAQRINELGLTTIRPKAVRSSAEVLFDAQRSEIEKAFGCPVFDFYGSREVNNLAAECPAHQGLHVMAPGRIVEIVDVQGHPVARGTVGNLAITDLTNFSFPFIRYLNGDMGSMSSELCACGRTFPVLDKLVGRSSDVLSFNGCQIHGEFFTHLFYGQPEVKQFQVSQDGEHLLTLRIVPALEPFDITAIVAAIRRKAGADVRIHVEWVATIPALASGKFRFTINNHRRATFGPTPQGGP